MKETGARTPIVQTIAYHLTQMLTNELQLLDWAHLTAQIGSSTE